MVTLRRYRKTKFMIVKSIIKQFLLVVNILVADLKFLGWNAGD